MDWTSVVWRYELLWVGLADEAGSAWSAVATDVDVERFVNSEIVPLIPGDEPRLGRPELAAAVVEFCGDVDEFWAWIPTMESVAKWFDLGAEAPDLYAEYWDVDLQVLQSGDDQAVLGLLTDDAALYVPFDDTPDEPERATWELDLAWFTAQGTVLRSPSCAVAEDQPESGTAVVCDYDTLDAVAQAVNAVPIPTTTRFVVTSLGLISEIRETYGTPDFANAGEPFQRWLEANRPDLTCLPWYVDRSCGESRSVEEERAIGRRVAQYPQEFGTYLETNDCTYQDFAPGLTEPTCVESRHHVDVGNAK